MAVAAAARRKAGPAVAADVAEVVGAGAGVAEAMPASLQALTTC